MVVSEGRSLSSNPEMALGGPLGYLSTVWAFVIFPLSEVTASLAAVDAATAITATSAIAIVASCAAIVDAFNISALDFVKVVSFVKSFVGV